MFNSMLTVPDLNHISDKSKIWQVQLKSAKMTTVNPL